MPQFKTGDIWQEYGKDLSVILVTTNNVIKANGELTMGQGSALHAVWKEPDIAKRFGEEIPCPIYGILWHEDWDIWAFQTKKHWREESDLDVIKFSCDVLKTVAENYPDCTFNLCYPGIGLGGLTKKTVKPFLDILPDNVVVWSYD